MKKQTDSSNVIAPPPLIYLGGLLLGILLHYLKPLEIFNGSSLIPLGGILIIISIFIFVISIMSFVRAHTEINPHKPTTSIIVNGPYRFSRNPIYLSMTLLYLGITVLFNDFWLLIILVPVLIIIRYGVIKREEEYLTKKFGKKYIQYKNSVRRWI